jgi:hypothetical protein
MSFNNFIVPDFNPQLNVFLQKKGWINTKAEVALLKTLEPYVKNILEIGAERAYSIPTDSYLALIKQQKATKSCIIGWEEGHNGSRGIFLNPLVPHDFRAIDELQALIQHTEKIPNVAAPLSQLIVEIQKEREFIKSYPSFEIALDQYRNSSPIFKQNAVIASLFDQIFKGKELTQLYEKSEMLLAAMEFAKQMKDTVSQHEVRLDKRILRWYECSTLGKLSRGILEEYPYCSLPSEKIWMHIFHTPPLKIFKHLDLGIEVTARIAHQKQYSFLMEITYGENKVFGNLDLTLDGNLCYHACFSSKAVPHSLLQQFLPLQPAFTICDNRDVEFKIFSPKNL